MVEPMSVLRVFGVYVVPAFLLLWFCKKFVFDRNVKKRVVRFKPVIEGHKFRRKESTSSSHVESVVKQYFGSNEVLTNGIRFERIDGVHPDFAFFIRNVFTADECHQLIHAAEKTGFEARKYSGKGDDSSSCCFRSDVLANEVVFERIKPYLPKKSYFDTDASLTLNELAHFYNGNQEISRECFGDLDCLNVSCRVEKYGQTQHLKVHRDGCVLVEGTRDVFTVYAIVIYLNDEFEKGFTRFCTDVDANPKDGKFPYSFQDVKGSIGDALVFRHEILHKGGVVDSGTKYILRLDAAYRMSNLD